MFNTRKQIPSSSEIRQLVLRKPNLIKLWLVRFISKAFSKKASWFCHSLVSVDGVCILRESQRNKYFFVYFYIAVDTPAT